MHSSRRIFLKQIGMAGGMLAFSGSIFNLFARPQDQTPDLFSHLFDRPIPRIPIDFRYAPASWQSLMSLPGENASWVEGREGELLFLDERASPEQKDSLTSIAISLAGKQGEFLDQKFLDPGIPVLTTRLKTAGAIITVTSFASKSAGEGRVDNHKIEILPDGTASLRAKLEFVVSTSLPLKIQGAQQMTQAFIGDNDASPFFAANAHAMGGQREKNILVEFDEIETSAGTPFTMILRFPREHQPLKKIEAGFDQWDVLHAQAIAFWQSLKLAAESLTAHPEYAPAATAAIRTILQCSESDEKKMLVRRGPGMQDKLFITDSAVILEALAQTGHLEEAVRGVTSVWNMQDATGLIIGSGGERSLKETGAALYLIARHAEWTQDGTYFTQLWPDIYRAVMQVRAVKDKAANRDKDLQSKYGLLPRGTIDADQTELRADLNNTLWMLMGLKKIVEVMDKTYTPKRTDVRDLYRDLLLAAQTFTENESVNRQGGVPYIPMIARDDPHRKEGKKSARPQPQFAQFAMTTALFPGLLFPIDHAIVQGHAILLENILKEDVPAGSGVLDHDGFQSYHAAAAARFFVWLGKPDRGSRIFRGLLNHASPLYNWWDEQSLHDAVRPLHAGAMPSALTAAEVLLYLRSILLIEDVEKLRVFDGVLPTDLQAGKPLMAHKTPTRWGSVSVLLEPVNATTWHGRFVREEFNMRLDQQLKWIEFPRLLTRDIQFDKLAAGKGHTNGDRVLVEPNLLSWDVTWRDFSKK